MSRALEVPIHVDAIAIPASGAPRGSQWAGATTDDTFTDAAALEPGVHLQWALPDALARGSISEDGDVRFPTVPERWMVLRFNPPRAGARRSYQAWIVDAQTGGRPSPLGMWVGVNRSASAPRLTAAGLQDAAGELQAIDGVKGPTVASYYRDCRGRFGFHDPLNTGVVTELSAPPGDSPPRTGPLTYLVVGWYADPGRDPFHQLKTWTDRLDWMVEAGWSADSIHLFAASWVQPEVEVAVESTPSAIGVDFGDVRITGGRRGPGRLDLSERPGLRIDPGDLRAPDLEGVLTRLDQYTTDTTQTPDRLVLHGQVVDVAWGGAGGRHFDPNVPLRPGDPGAEPPSITVGSSLSEALAHVVGQGESGVFVEAVQHGLTGQLATAEGLERLPHLLHERSFASQPGTPDVRYIVELHDPSTRFEEDDDDPEVGAGPRLDIPGKLRGLRDVPRSVTEIEVRDHRADRLRPAVAVGSAGPNRPGAMRRLRSGLRIDAARRAVLGDARRAFTGPVSAAGTRVDHVADLVTLADAGMANGVRIGRPLAEVVAAGGPFGGARAHIRRVEYPTPRWWKPNAPALLVKGPKRSYRHGFDGRFDASGLLATRAEGQAVSSVLPTGGVPENGRVSAAALFIERSDLQKVPPAVRELVREAVLLDPTNAERMGRVAADASNQGARAAEFSRAFEVEATYWWGARSPEAMATSIAEQSGYAGVLPSVLALQPWAPGWAPVLLEVEVEYLPAAGALKSDWPLGGVEHEPAQDPPALGAEPSRHRFRLLPTAAAVLSLADSVEALAKDGERIGGLSSARRQALRTLARQIEDLDLLTCSLAGLDDLLRAEGVDVRVGALRVVRARLVDVFGQVVPVVGTDAANPGDEVVLPDGERAVLLTPRVPQWSRLMFRFMGPGWEAEPGTGESPVCGWLLPDHVEHAVEVFDADGLALGQLRHREPGSLVVVWEPSPGTEPPAGRQATSTIEDPDLAGLVQGILDHNLRLGPEGDPGNPGESALSALVRVIDTVQGTVDRVGETQEYLATILGRPVAVTRLRTTFQVREDASGPTPRPENLELRLGSLAQLDDGLLGYYLDGDYTQVHPPDPLVAAVARPSGPRRGLLGDGDTSGAPIESPYVNVDPTVDLEPGVPRSLLLLMDPRAGVHAATGVLPRKRVALDREHVDAALAALAPTFEAGPVLLDPAASALPIPTLEGFAWSWTRREGPPGDAAGWSETPLVASSGAAVIPDRPVSAQEGWLRLRSEE